MKFGYMRASTIDQNLDRQEQQLKEAGCERIFFEKVTGVRRDRPELNHMLEFLRQGANLKSLKEAGIRQIAMIREYRQAKIFNDQARQIMLNITKRSVLEKDDIINIAIDESVKHSYELPSFSTLTKTVDHVRAELYRTIADALTIEERQKIDQLFQSRDGSTYSDWNVVKQDPGRPTLYQLRRWIYRKNWLNERHVGSKFFQRLHIPPASLLSVQFASSHKKSEGSLQELKKKKKNKLIA